MTLLGRGIVPIFVNSPLYNFYCMSVNVMLQKSRISQLDRGHCEAENEAESKEVGTFVRRRSTSS